MPTEKLYFADPFRSSFETGEARLGQFAGKPSIVLDRTIFYPEAGGQLADTGTLHLGDRAFAIDDTQIDDEGIIHHLTSQLAAGDLGGVSGAARGEIDLGRRRDHMAQHTAQHMLSRALADLARTETVSARLGANSCTVDVSASSLGDAVLARAEDLVNAVIRDDVEIRQLFPTDEELETLPLRRAPKVTKDVRLIAIGDFDLSPCGGTHCTRSGQIGLFRVSGSERYKGGVRVFFNAGERALRETRAKEGVLTALATDLTCGLLDVGTAVAKLRGELKTRLDALSSARGELVLLVADKALADHPAHPSGTTRIVVLRDKDDVAMLRALAGRLTSRPDVVAICASKDPATGDFLVVVQRGAGTTFDCAAWLKAATVAKGGRGGGKPDRAEGRLPAEAKSELESPPLA
ncbi:MAG: alanine--tRNA ligase-related protein [Polyangiaceae bacterium]